MNNHIRRAASLTIGCAITFAIVVMPAQLTNAAPKWKFTEDNVSLGLNGVSPHVEKTPAGDRVFRSDMVPTGTAVTMCDSAGNCTSESFSTGSTGPISDFTVAKAKSGMRAYFKKTDATNQGIYSAPCLTADCLTFGTPVLTSTDMQISKDQRAWGVPDPVTLQDGRVRIYIVEKGPSVGSCPEALASYISTDGISFKKEKGWRLTGGFVDSEVLRVKKNNWVMIVADGPGCGGNKSSPKPQQLFITTSKDGLKWAKPKALTSSSVGRLDPTGYEMKKNTFRIYYASGLFTDPNYSIRRATLTLK